MPYIIVLTISLILLYWADILEFVYGVLVYIVLPIIAVTILIYIFKSISRPPVPPDIQPRPEPEPPPPPPKGPVADTRGWTRTTWSDEGRNRIVRMEVDLGPHPKTGKKGWNDLRSVDPQRVMHRVLKSESSDTRRYAKIIEQALADIDAHWKMSWDERWIETPNVRFTMTEDRKSLKDALVRTGSYRNRTFHDLKATEYAQLCAGLRKIDQAGVSLLSVVQRHAGAEATPEDGTEEQPRPPSTEEESELPPFTGLTQMTVHDAREVLGIENSPSSRTAKDRSRELLQVLHPDHGGSTVLTQLILKATQVATDAPLTDRPTQLQRNGAMSRGQAAEILELEPDADRAQVNRGARELLGLVHPEGGGSRRLEQLVIQARAILREPSKP